MSLFREFCLEDCSFGDVITAAPKPPTAYHRWPVELVVCQIDQTLCENCAVKDAFTVNYWVFVGLWFILLNKLFLTKSSVSSLLIVLEKQSVQLFSFLCGSGSDNNSVNCWYGGVILKGMISG